jgi:P27 family predicted phage terminase small subunit
VKTRNGAINGATKPRCVSPPPDFTPDARKLWHATQRQLRRQGTWQPQDATLLASYVRAVQLAQSARKAAEDTPFVPGSRGQLTVHPGVKLSHEAARDAHRYAEALLLTPQTRARHGITTTQADTLDSILA